MSQIGSSHQEVITNHHRCKIFTFHTNSQCATWYDIMIRSPPSTTINHHQPPALVFITKNGSCRKEAQWNGLWLTWFFKSYYSCLWQQQLTLSAKGNHLTTSLRNQFFYSFLYHCYFIIFILLLSSRVRCRFIWFRAKDSIQRDGLSTTLCN